MYYAKPPYIRGVFINHLKRARLRLPGKTMRKEIVKEFGWITVSGVQSRGYYYFDICGYPAYIEVFCHKLTIQIISNNIGEKKKIAFIESNFPKKKFISNLIASRMQSGLSMNDILEIKKGIELLRK